MLKYHVKTDSDGVTVEYLSDDSVFVSRGIDGHLNPNTDYTVTIEEGKPVRYPRYFINPNSAQWYCWYDKYSAGRVSKEDGNLPPVWYENTVERLENWIEVTREQAEAHIRGEPEPETCVWTRKEADNMWQVGCLRSGFGIQMAIGYRWCPFCRLQIEFRNPHQNPEENREPETPDGYRVLEEWEVEVARELELPKPRDYYCEKYFYLNWLYSEHMFTSDTWDEKHYAVPEDFSVMPKCRDCGQQTMVITMPISEYRVECESGSACTKGPCKNTKAEAVKAYPRKQ